MSEYGYVLMSGGADEYDTYPLGVVDDAVGAAWIEQYGDGGVVQRVPRVDAPPCERYEVLVLTGTWSIVGDVVERESVETRLRYPAGILPTAEWSGTIEPAPPTVECGGPWPIESGYTLRMYLQAVGTNHAEVRAVYAAACAAIANEGVAATITRLWRDRIPAWAWRTPVAGYGPPEQGRILREHGATP